MARFLKDRTKSQGAAPGSLIFIGKQKMTKNKDFTNSAKNSTTKIRERDYIAGKTAKRPCCGRRT